MFRDSRVMDRERTASSFDSAYTRYARTNEGWFDGTVNSVDRRLAHCDKLLHSARSTVARMTVTDSQPYLRAAERLHSDREALAGLRDDLLTGASNREDVTGPPGWRTAKPWYDGPPVAHALQPNDYPSRREYLDAVNLSGYLGDSVDKNPQGGWDAKANDYAVPSLEHDMTRGQKPAEPTRNVSVPSNVPRAWSPQPQKQPALAAVDKRYVTLEAAKFVSANTDTVDDLHELAVRAHNHAALQTSTFSQQRSAAVCRAFVEQAVELGRKTYRPPVKRVAACQDFADEAMFL